MMEKYGTKHEQKKGMLLNGLKDRSVKRPDPSMTPRGGSVDDDATRSTTGDNTSLSGGRTA